MASWSRGRAVAVDRPRPGLISALVDVGGEQTEAVGFSSMLGPVKVGDLLVLNTTGLELGLGTGGVAFILWNLDSDVLPEGGPGHIVKLRYTPWQTEVLAAEAPESPDHEALAEITSIDGMPVIACGLHSQIAGAAAGVKAMDPGARVGYLMTDGAALPLAWSDLVASLESAGLLDVTATCGHAFGGALETVNVYSGLAALRGPGRCDAAVVAMGPGVVGTNTRLGFTALEQGQVLDAATALGGRSLAALRISFADPRARHRGVSHHTLTALMLAAREPATVVVPELADELASVVEAQLATARLAERHKLVKADGAPGVELLRDLAVRVTSMGLTLDEAPELWLAAAAAGAVAART